MEQGIREFLKRIINALSTALLWMIINMTAGIKFNLAFFEGSPSLYNVLFYVWFVISLGFLIWYLLKLWRKPLEMDE